MINTGVNCITYSMKQYLHNSAPVLQSDAAMKEYVQKYPIQGTSQSIPFINKLPISVMMVQEKRYTKEFKTPGTIAPYGTLELPYDSVDDGDIFHFMYKKNNNKYFTTKSYNMTKKHGPVIIGNVSVYPAVFKRDISAGGDLSSINIRNLLPWPIIVSQKGIKDVIYVEANPHLGDPLNHGNITISPSVYYDNNNMGINIGTTFDVSIDNHNNVMGIPTPDPSVVPLYSFTITDIDESEILIGNVGAMVDKSVATGANAMIGRKQQTGRAIYRIGKDIPLSDIPPEGVGIRAKNAKGTDYVRANLVNNTKQRSTNPSSRYPQLSGRNLVNGLSL